MKRVGESLPQGFKKFFLAFKDQTYSMVNFEV